METTSNHDLEYNLKEAKIKLEEEFRLKKEERERKEEERNRLTKAKLDKIQNDLEEKIKPHHTIIHTLQIPTQRDRKSTESISPLHSPRRFENLLKEINKVDKWILGKKVGKGSYSEVILGTNDNETVAIKIIDKVKMVPKHVTAEINALTNLHHQNIISSIKIIEEECLIFIVMPYCEHNLLSLLDTKKIFTELEAREIILQIIKALEYAADNGNWVHRDLKCENVLLLDNCVKLADWGYSTQYDDKPMTDYCGSISYMAPEICEAHPYGPEVDVWSLGVILYTLVSSNFPFDEASDVLTRANIRRGDFKVNPKWSPELLNLLSRIFQVNPETRIKLHQLTIHPWFSFSM